MAKAQAETDNKPKKRGRPRQQALPGTEDSAITEIERAAEDYAVIRDQRMELNSQEATLKKNLLTLMKKHGKTHYKRGPIDILLVVEEETVKVRIKKTKDEESED